MAGAAPQKNTRSPMSATVTNPASPEVVAAWKAAGEPSGADYVDWANAYYKRHVRDNDGTWNAHLVAALGGRAQPEQHVCRIF